jgi:hypothetical protein
MPSRAPPDTLHNSTLNSYRALLFLEAQTVNKLTILLIPAWPTELELLKGTLVSGYLENTKSMNQIQDEPSPSPKSALFLTKLPFPGGKNLGLKELS